MLKLTFKQTPAELMVRAASTIIFNTLNRLEYPFVTLSELAENPQYGFTASASLEEIGVKFVRITDLKDGGISWDTVPYCKCDEPGKYLIYPNDILFARTGATTGKTHLVKEAPHAVFASYLIRIRPKLLVEPEYLYSFFQSDAYWTQILEEKEGSAQPNVNGQKLMNILVPMLDSKIQVAISKFLEVVRNRQDGSFEELPELPPPLEEQRRIVARVEELVGKIEEVRSLRQKALEETEIVLKSVLNLAFERNFNKQGWELIPLRQAAEVARGKFTHRPRNEPRFYGGNIPFIQIGDISNSKRYILEYSQTLNEEGLKISKMFPKETVVIAITGATIGVTGILTFDSCFPDSIVGIVPDQEKVIPEFVYWSLEYTKKVALAEATQTTQPNINLKNLDKLTIPVPPLSEQRRIVTYLDELQTKIDTMKQLREEAIKELDALLPSILDKAFKGEL